MVRARSSAEVRVVNPILNLPRSIALFTWIFVLSTTGSAQAQPNDVRPVPSTAPRIAGVVAAGTPVELLATDLGGSEGPVAAPDGTLLFTAGPVILRVDENGRISTFLEDTRGITGLGFDSAGRLIGVRTDPAEVVMLLPERKLLSDAISARPFLRPNDLAIARNGGIYFSDQPRRAEQTQVPGRKQGLLYRMPTGPVIQVDDRIDGPNGVVLSPDERVLYAGDTSADTLFAFDVNPDGTLTNRRRFGHLEGVTRTSTGISRSRMVSPSMQRAASMSQRDLASRC